MTILAIAAITKSVTIILYMYVETVRTLENHEARWGPLTWFRPNGGN